MNFVLTVFLFERGCLGGCPDIVFLFSKMLDQTGPAACYDQPDQVRVILMPAQHSEQQCHILFCRLSDAVQILFVDGSLVGTQ